MKLYMHPVSMTSRPVRLFIADAGIDIEQQVVDLMTGEHHQEPFVSINPNRLVPVLDDGDFRLTESSVVAPLAMAVAGCQTPSAHATSKPCSDLLVTGWTAPTPVMRPAMSPCSA